MFLTVNKDVLTMFMMLMTLPARDASALGSIKVEVCVWGGDYLLRGSASNIPMETGTSSVAHVIFQGWGLITSPLALDPSKYSDVLGRQAVFCYSS